MASIVYLYRSHDEVPGSVQVVAMVIDDTQQRLNALEVLTTCIWYMVTP